MFSQIAVVRPVETVREADNRFYHRAVRINGQEQKLGYLPHTENATVAQMHDRGERLFAIISDRREDLA